MLLEIPSVIIPRLSPVKGERRGRRAISSEPKLERLAAPQWPFQDNRKRVWSPFSGLFRVKDNAPGPEVHKSFPRPKLHSSECDVSGMEPRVPVSIPSFLHDRKRPEQADSGRGSKSHFSSPLMARSTMVPNATSTTNGSANLSSTMEELPKGLRRKGTQPRKGKTTTDSCMSSPRAALVGRGFSERAANLILSARRESTSRTYSGPWKKWDNWCSQRDLDPYKAPITEIADFLSECYSEGLSASYIGVIRSAI